MELLVCRTDVPAALLAVIDALAASPISADTVLTQDISITVLPHGVWCLSIGTPAVVRKKRERP